MGVFCNFNMPRSCIQESRPLLATVIRIGSGLPVGPRVGRPRALCGREAVAELGGSSGQCCGQQQLQPRCSQGWADGGGGCRAEGPQCCRVPQSQREKSRVINSVSLVEMCFSWLCLVAGVRWRERGVVCSHTPYQGEVP